MKKAGMFARLVFSFLLFRRLRWRMILFHPGA